MAGNGSCCACSPGGAVAQRLRGCKSAEPSALGLKGASSPFFVAPARRNRCDLAVLNAQHLLRKPVCDLKAPLGLSCLAGTAALFFSFGVKREHPRQPPLAQRSVFTLRWRLRKQKTKRTSSEEPVRYGRGSKFRTHGTRFWRPLLYQLSYTPKSLEVPPLAKPYGGPSGTRTQDRSVMSRLL